MRQIQLAAALTLILAGLGLPGCGSAEDRVPLVSVEGTITQGGKPLAGAALTFIPEQGNKDNTPGSALTDEAGHYDAKWMDRTGLALGSYKVMVVADPAAAAGEIHPDFVNDPYMAQLSNESAALGKKKAAVDYNKQEFKADVTDAGGTFDYKLEEPPSGGSTKK